MIRIRTVLCPVDFTVLSKRELEVAVELCETFEARLVLHHNEALAAPAWSKAWEWEMTHPEDADAAASADGKMKHLLGRIPESVAAEALLSRGPVVPVLLHLVRELPADLLVLGSHGWSSEEHASVTERLIESCPCPVFTIHDEAVVDPELHASRRFRLRGLDGYDLARVLVPTDFSDAGDAAVDYAFELARTLPLRLHLFHVVPPRHDEKSSAAQRKLEAMVPPELAERTDCSVRAGSVSEALEAFAERFNPRLIVMGRHAPGFLRHAFTHDHARDMLHRAHCPVWFAA